MFNLSNVVNQTFNRKQPLKSLLPRIPFPTSAWRLLSMVPAGFLTRGTLNFKKGNPFIFFCTGHYHTVHLITLDLLFVYALSKTSVVNQTLRRNQPLNTLLPQTTFPLSASRPQPPLTLYLQFIFFSNLNCPNVQIGPFLWNSFLKEIFKCSRG